MIRAVLFKASDAACNACPFYRGGHRGIFCEPGRGGNLPASAMTHPDANGAVPVGWPDETEPAPGVQSCASPDRAFPRPRWRPAELTAVASGLIPYAVRR